jgi:hypothetical protein
LVTLLKASTSPVTIKAAAGSVNTSISLTVTN